MRYVNIACKHDKTTFQFRPEIEFYAVMDTMCQEYVLARDIHHDDT